MHPFESPGHINGCISVDSSYDRTQTTEMLDSSYDRTQAAEMLRYHWYPSDYFMIVLATKRGNKTLLFLLSSRSPSPYPLPTQIPQLLILDPFKTLNCLNKQFNSFAKPDIG